MGSLSQGEPPVADCLEPVAIVGMGKPSASDIIRVCIRGTGLLMATRLSLAGRLRVSFSAMGLPASKETCLFEISAEKNQD